MTPEDTQESADFLSLVEKPLTWPEIDPSLLPDLPPSVIAAKRLGYEPFSYTERS